MRKGPFSESQLIKNILLRAMKCLKPIENVCGIDFNREFDGLERAALDFSLSMKLPRRLSDVRGPRSEDLFSFLEKKCTTLSSTKPKGLSNDFKTNVLASKPILKLRSTCCSCDFDAFSSHAMYTRGLSRLLHAELSDDPEEDGVRAHAHGSQGPISMPTEAIRCLFRLRNSMSSSRSRHFRRPFA